MAAALGLSGPGEGFTLSSDSVGMGSRGLPGYLTGIAERRVNGQALSLAFHGSLYNLKELFPSGGQDSDPFTGLLRLYLREGTAFVGKLRGEFALAIWDGVDETLYLASDRFRVHPLFYYQDQDKLVFASRLRGILACPLPLKLSINLEAIVDVVGSSVISTPKTIFKEVRKLPPGHILTFRKGNTRLSPYWEISFLHSSNLSEEGLAEALKTYVADAVSVRLKDDGVSDRIGTFLSGGVDSSTVTGVLTQLALRPIKSFSIGFDEHRFNEINYARIAAAAFGAEHYEYVVKPKDACDAIPVLLDAFDEPFGNASAVPTYCCARMAREHGVDVLYAGDGGDELFGGNERYGSQRLFEYYTKIPWWLREPLVKPMIFGLADTLRLKVLIRARKYIQRASIPYPERLYSYGFFKAIPTTDLLEEDFLGTIGRDYNAYAPIHAHYSQAPAATELDRQLYIDLKLAISDNDLFKVTRMSEAAGVTVRFPFLDHRLAEFAASVPASIKMRGRQLRSFFKKAYADLLPLETRTKRKHGFGLPIHMWLRTDTRLREMMEDLVLSPASVQRGYFRKQALEDIVRRHQGDATSFYGTALWNLMILELWQRRYLYGRRW